MATGDVDQRIRDTQREYAEFLDDYVSNENDIASFMKLNCFIFCTPLF